MDDSSQDWTVTERRTTYRALSRAVLSDALGAAGFQDITWQMPEQSGFYQPVVSARATA
jgi:glycine/sarcosine N-methyltransferase